jgi:hypothetical protein
MLSLSLILPQPLYWICVFNLVFVVDIVFVFFVFDMVLSSMCVCSL